jgi:hypothetical protein
MPRAFVAEEAWGHLEHALMKLVLLHVLASYDASTKLKPPSCLRVVRGAADRI